MKPGLWFSRVLQFSRCFPDGQVVDAGVAEYKRHAFRIAAVPGVFGRLNFLAGGFFGEWRQGRARVHISFCVWFSIQPQARRGAGATAQRPPPPRRQYSAA